MNMKETEKNEEIEIDLSRLFGAVLNRLWLVVLVSVLCAVTVFLGAFFLIAPEYQSTATFYASNQGLLTQNSPSPGDISASRELVQTYIVILDTRETLLEVIDHAGVDRTERELRKMIEAEVVDGTEIFQVVVTGTDPQEAERIADAIAHVLPKRISAIVEGASVKVVDGAVAASRPSSPDYFKCTVLGFVLGFAASVAVIVLRELLDTSIRAQEDIAQVCSYPVLAAIPEVDASDKAAAAEAYKLLRTKLQYSFAEPGNCRIIGISSAMTGEGKSLTAVNLAYALSQLDKRVLLMDCDMRCSSLETKLPIAGNPGLSDFLSGQTHPEGLIQPCGMKGCEKAFHVIAAGQNPPNPVELLSSDRMTRLLEKLRGVYDYVILDLPPVGNVSDALAVSGATDGILLVVRRCRCDRAALRAALQQFEFVGSRLLGIVYNCSEKNSGTSGKKAGKAYCGKY